MYTRRSESKTILFSSLASTKHIYGVRPDIAVVENSKAVLCKEFYLSSYSNYLDVFSGLIKCGSHGRIISFTYLTQLGRDQYFVPYCMCDVKKMVVSVKML